MNKEIKTKRLVLRPLSVNDLEAVHFYSADEENTKYMKYLPNKSKQETLTFLESVCEEWKKSEPSFLEFGIGYENRIIGSIGIYLNDERTGGEIGWILSKEYWNQGFMTEAALAVKEYAQNELHLSTLEAYCDTRNNASAKVMQNMGMTLEYSDGSRYYEKNESNALECKYTMNLQRSERILLLEEALRLYGMEHEDTRFIRHNENMTFQIGDKYLLRIHKRVEGFTEADTYKGLDPLEVRRQELEFLQYLHSCGIRVQTPVPNQSGELVTLLSDGVPATMLTWLEGHTVEEEGCTLGLATQIGEMTAKMHQAAMVYEAVISNKMPHRNDESLHKNNDFLHYDEHLCERLKEKLFQVVKKSELLQEYRDSMAGALDVIAKKLQESKKDSILVHSDLSLSNILVTPNNVVPIDFSLFGYCHPMMDIGGLYCYLNGVDLRRAVADGYRKAGGKIDYHALDCCFALGILLGVITHCEGWLGQDWFADRMKHWSRETFEPLTKGKELFSSDFIMLNVL